MDEKLVINKKGIKGDDGHKTFSVRLRNEIIADLDNLSQKTNRSRNELINTLLDYAIKHCEVK